MLDDLVIFCHFPRCLQRLIIRLQATWDFTLCFLCYEIMQVSASSIFRARQPLLMSCRQSITKDPHDSECPNFLIDDPKTSLRYCPHVLGKPMTFGLV